MSLNVNSGTSSYRPFGRYSYIRLG